MCKDLAKQEVQNFWGALYNSLYDDIDSSLSKELLMEGLCDLEHMFHFRNYMTVKEISLTSLRGKKVLEIGSGSGGHSALFAKYGAIMSSADITFSRAKSTQIKFDLMGDLAMGCQSLQTDAENLPFSDNTFDIVYSNGVLHHTPNTERAIGDIYRVLKPGGKSVIMLYCKDSWHYWFNMFLCVGILTGKIFTGPNWLGRATEWGGKKNQTVENPITRCYTSSGVKKLFERFDSLTLRKGEFNFYLIPKIGRLYRKWQILHYGTHPGGNLVYGEPWPISSPIELWLGKFIGWDWFISATKPHEKKGA